MMRWRWRRLRRACRSRCGCCRARTARRSRRRATKSLRAVARAVTRRHAAAGRDAGVAAVLVDAAHEPGGGDHRASFHWHLEILPRLTPVSGLAWDGGVAINPVPPEEAAQVLRAHRLMRASECADRGMRLRFARG